MKTIVSFKEKKYALFIDLQDQFSSLAIDKSTGCILLNEGIGKGRVPRGIVRPESVNEFSVTGESIMLSFMDGQEHLVGQTHDLVHAKRWVIRANNVISHFHPEERPKIKFGEVISCLKKWLHHMTRQRFLRARSKASAGMSKGVSLDYAKCNVHISDFAAVYQDIFNIRYSTNDENILGNHFEEVICAKEANHSRTG